MREVRHAGDAAHCNDTGSGGVAGGGPGAGAGAGGDVQNAASDEVLADSGETKNTASDEVLAVRPGWRTKKMSEGKDGRMLERLAER